MDLKLVGLGPGHSDQMTQRARVALEQSDEILGYERYVKQVKGFLGPEATTRTYDLGEEVDRAGDAIDRVLSGRSVSLVSGGDVGIYAMASPVFEMLEARQLSSVDVEVIPGITALSAASARLGAPVAQDFAAISLSDFLTPMDRILKRVDHAARSDFVVVFYNPRSRKRPDHLREALDRIRDYRDETTPVGVVRNAYRSEESCQVRTLADVSVPDVDMVATVIVGNSRTRRYAGWIYTPRGYEEVR